MANDGTDMMAVAKELFPLNRSLAGHGNIQTLKILKTVTGNLDILGFESGSRVFDWVVPPVWECRSGSLRDPSGKVLCDYNLNNLSVVGYSVGIKARLSLEELMPHLHSVPSQPNAIPYVTSYYAPNWGFCLTDYEKSRLETGTYEVEIDVTFHDGEMSYGELLIPGEQKTEIFFSTYICHPSMANNEISGPVVAAFLAKYVNSIANRKHSYRFVFLPETIGAIAYLSRNLAEMKEKVIAGWVLTCVGDDRDFSFLPSRSGSSLADYVSLDVFESQGILPTVYSWLERGSDERQYCAPGVDLPVASVMRTKYWQYPEYHTSLDTLGDVVTETGLQGALEFYKDVIDSLEDGPLPRSLTLGEPQLGKRGLYSQISKIGSGEASKNLLNVWSFCDGIHTVGAIVRKTKLSTQEVRQLLWLLKENGLISS
jgi:aminopeptidase-like protein